MQSPSLLSPATTPSSWPCIYTFRRFYGTFQNQNPNQNRSKSLVFSSSTLSPFPHRSGITHGIVPPSRSTGVHEIAQTSEEESEFIETGYISGVHGLQGEVRVKPKTDFHELRFSTPGKRWLRQQVLGKAKIQEVNLLEGRGSQNNWIVKFNDVDTVDQAHLLVGSTLLVREEDKPQLEDGEFYSRDLVGMRVLLKETGEAVGTVVNVYNTGANDLLHVMLDLPGGQTSVEGASGPLVLVPFVEAIVPIVDTDKKEMMITPPKGLLELNIRTVDKSKKERRQLEWKERKQLQQRLIAAKKKLCSMEQQHVFHGLRYGEKSQRSLLADQIVSLRSNLLLHALPSKRWNLDKFVKLFLARQRKNTLRISKQNLSHPEKEGAVSRFQDKGQFLTYEGKVATILLVDEREGKGSGFGQDSIDGAEESTSLLVEKFFQEYQCFEKEEGNASVPLILICPTHMIDPLKQLFLDHDHFTFDSEKVWFLEAEKLPVISGNSIEEPNKNKILMKSPWEILQTPVGSGGLVSLLSSVNILENLTSMGVEYIKVCNLWEGNAGGDVLVGLVSSSEANIGIGISSKDMKNLEERVEMVFSMEFIKKLVQQGIKDLRFDLIPKQHPCVELVEKEWVDVVPSSPNSYEVHCSIYSYVYASDPDRVCILEVID
ncbi:uncharacterized protein LOC124941739 isoform X2 [Impatiens glandulifera]|uniref:uncharacterized protein LOC124941739 isoform X2 n=1 Tax=Impatiens glandulifera TaxID=253017 RepID=UPI001FB0A39A|nr:uncharacterized protein LOC124941739 isoform X2 [Impatiens glandulifera]